MRTKKSLLKRVLNPLLSLVLCLCMVSLMTMPVQAYAYDSRACYANAFAVTVSFRVAGETDAVKTLTFDSKDGVNASISAEKGSVVLEADTTYYMEISYSGPSANTNYQAKVNDIASPEFRQEMNSGGTMGGPMSTFSASSNSGYANSGYREYRIGENQYGKYRVDFSLNGIVAGFNSDTANRYFEITVLFQGEGNTESSNTFEVAAGSTMTASNILYTADQYTYKWQKNGTGAVLSTAQSYHASNSVAGETYVCTVQRADTSSVNGCTGSGTWTYTYNVKNKAEWTTQPTAANPTYTGSALKLVNAGTSGHGTVYYATSTLFGIYYDWSTEIPTGTDAKSYTVYAYIDGNENYVDSDIITLTSTIRKPNASVTKAPTPVSGLKYDESAKNLIVTGEASGGTMQYAIGENASTAPSSGWSTVIPTGTDEGTYYVWYKVKGDSTHNDSAAYVVTASISKGTPQYVVPQGLTATYGDTLSDVGLTGSGGTWSWQDASASVGNVGQHTFKATYTPDNKNYNTVTDVDVTVTVNKASLTVAADNKTVNYGDVSPVYTVTYSGFKNGDDKSDLGGSLAFECDYEQFDDKGQYVITPKGYTSDNYTFNYVNGELKVDAKPITVTIDSKSSIYGDQIVTLTASDNGIVNNDTDVYKLTTAASKIAGIGKYDIIGTALDDNYSITFANEEDAYEITKRELTVTVVVADKKYDGLNTSTITSANINNIANGDNVGLVSGTATFESVNAANGIDITFTDFSLSGEEQVLKNYTLTQPTGIKANITNDWTPAVNVDYTVSEKNGYGWLKEDFKIKAVTGYKVSLTNTAAGEWVDELTGSIEGDDSSITFFVKKEADGTISLAKTENYKLDKVAPTGKVSFDAGTGWDTFLDNITFELFYQNEVTVKVNPADDRSGVATVEYVASHEAKTLDQVEAISSWTDMPENGVAVTLEDAKKFVYFIRITDKAGNVTYLSTNGAEYDTTAPVISGIEEGKPYYTTQSVSVADKNLSTITVNGTSVTDISAAVILEGDKDASYTIVATDKAGNSTTVTITMKPIETISAPIDDITEDNVKSIDEERVQDVLDQAEELLTDDDMTDEEKDALEAIRDNAEKLLDKIEESAAAIHTESIEKVKDITDENALPEHNQNLVNAMTDLQKALENGENYTYEERLDILDEIRRIDEALVAIANGNASAEQNPPAGQDQLSGTKSPLTGDDSLGMWYALLIAGSAGVLGMRTLTKKKRAEEN